MNPQLYTSKKIVPHHVLVQTFIKKLFRIPKIICQSLIQFDRLW